MHKLKGREIAAVRSVRRLISFINRFSLLTISTSDIAGAIQKHLEGANNSALKSQHGVRMSLLSRYIPTQEKRIKNPRK